MAPKRVRGWKICSVDNPLYTECLEEMKGRSIGYVILRP